MSSGIYYPGANADDGYWRAGAFQTDLEYHSLGSDNVSGVNIFMRFLSVAIDNKSVIAAAFIRFISANTTANQPTINIWGNDVDNAVAPTNEAGADALVKTTAVKNWNITAEWTDGAAYDSLDITNIIQEIVNRAGWSNGNALQIIINDDESGANIRKFVRSYNYLSSTKKPELHISWGPPPAGGALFFGMNF